MNDQSKVITMNQQPGSADQIARCSCPSGDGDLAWPCPRHGVPSPQIAEDLPPLPKPDHSLQRLGAEEINYYTGDQVRQAQRDAIAASRRASSLPDVAMPEPVGAVVDKNGGHNTPSLPPTPQVVWFGAIPPIGSNLFAAQPAEGSAQVAQQKCKRCNGSGLVHNSSPVRGTCPVCQGSGTTPAAVVRAAPADARYRFLLSFLLERGVLHRYDNGVWRLRGIYGVDDSGLKGAGRTPEEALDNAIIAVNLDPITAEKFWRASCEAVIAAEGATPAGEQKGGA